MKNKKKKRKHNTTYLPVWITLFLMLTVIATVVILRSGLSRPADPSPATAQATVPATPAAMDLPTPARTFDGIVSMQFSPQPATDEAADEPSPLPVPEVDKAFEGSLPVLYLSTDDGRSITSRDDYASGKLQLDGVEYTLGIRGRGNTSWRYFPQKSYLLKLDERVSLLGMVPAQKYVLVSSYSDRSLIRNCVAMDIAACMDHLEYTPKQCLVDVYLNNKYIGVYTFSEKIEPGQDKIDLFAQTGDGIQETVPGETPFLLETGMDLFNFNVRYGKDYFTTPHSPRLTFLYPEFDTAGTEEAKYIMDYMNAVDSAFVNKEGYEDLIDVASWVDWFIVMEMTVNTDSALWRSTFLYRQEGGKLKIGPVWDFDMAMGNFSYDNPTYRYWASAEQIYNQAQNHYMSYLYKSDAFMEAVRARWDEKKEELLQTALDSVDRHAEEVSISRPYNDGVYGRSSRDAQATGLKDFLQKRYDWIDESIHMEGFNRHAPTQSIGETTNAENAAEGEDT
ncbi:MAG: CotH kinase family protein [Lachnospiraceae bacterium]|nr:CotH kinase family protein [Lachnospiraceae bacterium]